MAKSADAFRTISEVAEWLGVPAHVLRFWESRFAQVKPVKRAGGRRYYRPADMRLLAGIRRLLHDEGMTIKAVQTLLREKGVQHVIDLAPEPGFEATMAEDGAQVIRFTRSGPEPAAPEAGAEPEDAEDAEDAEEPEEIPQTMAAALPDSGADAERPGPPEAAQPSAPPARPPLPADQPEPPPAAGPGPLARLAALDRPIPAPLARRLAALADDLRAHLGAGQ
ncbi:MAG: MerR family transcriptional regulator [Roseovarius sp.]|nr:MerR family transcriptional regulator [Roseovarius sp.]